MKTFKLLGVMALLVCAMTIVTGCNNKKDKSEPDSIYPSAEFLIGTWKMISDIAVLNEATGLEMENLSIMCYFGPDEVFKMLDMLMSYRYNPYTGQLVIIQDYGDGDIMQLKGVLRQGSSENKVIWTGMLQKGEAELEFEKISTKDLLPDYNPESE